MTPQPASKTSSPSWMVTLCFAFGLISASVEFKVGDLLLTALTVLFFAMIIGVLSSAPPWRWALLLAIFIPGSRIFAVTVWHRFTERAEVYESFLAFLPAIVGTYGGALLRQVANTLFRGGN